MGNEWVIAKETWGKDTDWQVTDRWKTGEITWKDWIDRQELRHRGLRFAREGGGRKRQR